MRILHVPARTPYARRLVGNEITIVNGQTNDAPIPRDASLQWLIRTNDFSSFDVLHLHSIELVDLKTLKNALKQCKTYRKGVVFTAHDVSPMFSDDQKEYGKALKVILNAGALITTLTPSAANYISEKYRIPAEKIVVIPHGNVLPLDDPRWSKQSGAQDSLRKIFSIHGGFRPLGMKNKNAELRMLTRGISEIEFNANADARETIRVVRSSDNVDLRLIPFPSDNEIADFVQNSDIVLMPYKWGTHSGQLELAFDLGLPTVITDVGFYRDQYSMVPSAQVIKPIWVNWTDSNEYQYGSRLLEGILQVVNPHLGVQV